MKKTIILLILICISNFFAYNQKISNVDFKQSGSKIIVSYDLTGLKSGQFAIITLYVSTDGGKTFKGPLTEVAGDVGENVREGSNKSIQWEALKEIPDFGGNIVFDVRGIIKEEKIEVVKEVKKTKQPNDKGVFLGYNASYYAPIGFSFGSVRHKLGWYVSTRVNSGLFYKVDYKTDGENVLDFNPNRYYVFTDSEKIQRLSAMAGVIFLPNPKFGFYAGLGLSKYELLWGIEEFDYPDNLVEEDIFVLHEGESLLSLEIETGIKLILNRIIIGIGISSPNLKWVEGVATIGFVLF